MGVGSELGITSLFYNYKNDSLNVVNKFACLNGSCRHLTFSVICTTSFSSGTIRACGIGFRRGTMLTSIAGISFGRVRSRVSIVVKKFPYRSFSAIGPAGSAGSSHTGLCGRVMQFLRAGGPGFFVYRGMGNLLALRGKRVVEGVTGRFERRKCCVRCELLGTIRFNIPRHERHIVVINVEGSVSVACACPVKIGALSRTMPLGGIVSELSVRSGECCFSRHTIRNVGGTGGGVGHNL